MWLATDKIFDAFTFIVAETEFGPMQVHAYPFSSERSTFIVEMSEKTWRNAGFDTFAARGARRRAERYEKRRVVRRPAR